MTPESIINLTVIFASIFAACGYIFVLAFAHWPSFKVGARIGIATFLIIGIPYTFFALTFSSGSKVPYGWLLLSSCAVTFSIILYGMRIHLLLLYGVIELTAGAAAIVGAYQNPDQPYLPRALAVAGGVYILVRGLDNIDKSLPPRLKEPWDRFWGRTIPGRAPL